LAQFAQTDPYVKLPGFGLLKGGTFMIRLLSQNLTGIRPYLLPAEYNTFVFATVLQFDYFCNGTFSPPPLLIPPSPNSDTWEGRAEHSNVVVPFITNCEHGRATVTVRLTNPATSLDSRELYLPELYFVFVFIYAIVGFLFLWNQFTHLHFSISIHSGITFSAVLKTISCYFFARLWTEKAITDDFPMKGRMLAEISFVAAEVLLFTVNGLAVIGLGTYRDRLAVEDFLSLFLLSLWFFFTTSIIHCTSHVGFLTGLFLLLGIDFYLYAMFIYKSLVTALTLEDLFTATREHGYIVRLEMVIRFGGYVTVWMAAVLIVAAYVWIAPAWPLRKQLLEELCILALFAIDMHVFFYRESFRTATTRRPPPRAREEAHTDESVAWIAEPDRAYFAYLSALQ
jgi:hypothetical protein